MMGFTKVDLMEGADMRPYRVLIVDDESSLRTTLFRLLDKKGYHVVTASSRREAEALAQAEAGFDVALIDLRLPDGDGLELMTQLRQSNKNLQTIILTGFGTIESAVDAVQRGAFHFVTKPFSVDELLILIEKALTQKKLEQENVTLRSALHQKYQFDNIVGQSAEIRQVLEMIERVAATDSTVLITGESGTGKELVAKAIHYNSHRSAKAFVPINCGAIPHELLESELFGHVKGAFTGAIANRAGRFEMADGGTIFLDEIGDMNASLQVKLLRVLQERRFEPVGSAKTMEADIRVIAATNVDLEKAVDAGKFREDLFYRLNVIPIHIPALRERRSDIPILIHHFIHLFNRTKNRDLTGMSPEAQELLYNYDWPGNIRELENLIERLSILKGSGIIEVSDLPPRYRNFNSGAKLPLSMDGMEIPEHGVDFNTAVDQFENNLILNALEKTGWNRNQAAILLKLNRTTLVEKIKKKGLAQPPGVSQ